MLFGLERGGVIVLEEGQVIELLRQGGAGNKPYKERLTVIKIYGSMVLCRTEAGLKIGVSVGELIQNGVMRQDKEHEELRQQATQNYGGWHKKR